MRWTEQQLQRAVQNMPEDARQEVQKLLHARVGYQPLADFIREVAPREPPPRHLAPLIDALERARQKPLRLLLDMPPRCAKTTTIWRGLTWHMRDYPADVNGYYTYSDRIAKRHSRKWRKTLATHLPFEVRGNLNEYYTPYGGGLVVGGGESGLTSIGISGLLVIDDSIKGRKQANSKLQRDNVWDWFTDVAMTRDEGMSVIVVHTRWHEDDLIGRLQREQGEHWESISLPALAVENDPLGREVDELIWPERFDREYYEEKRRNNAWSFAALYQGAPVPIGGEVFSEPARYVLPKKGTDEFAAFIKGKRLAIGVDPAATEGGGDFSVACVLARDGHGEDAKVYVVDVVRRQMQVPDFVGVCVKLQQEYSCALEVEAVGGFKAVPQMIRDINRKARVNEVKPSTSKFQRAQESATAWGDGRLLVPTRAPWVDTFLDEVCRFTGLGDLHDDQVDAMAHAFARLNKAVVKRGNMRTYGLG